MLLRQRRADANDRNAREEPGAAGVQKRPRQGVGPWARLPRG